MTTGVLAVAAARIWVRSAAPAARWAVMSEAEYVVKYVGSALDHPRVDSPNLAAIEASMSASG